MTNRTKDIAGFKGRTQRFWDENPCGTSSSWQRSRELRFKYTDRYLLPFLRGPILKGRHVLEVGCGQGLDAAEIVNQCGSYVGIDLSPQSVRVAREQVVAHQDSSCPTLFLSGDAERLPFPDNAFDAVYSVGVLHHTPHFDRAIDEIHRVLKPGGTLILMLYHSFTPLWVILRTVRGGLRIPVLGPRLRRRLLNRLRNREDASDGTALLELIGSPIIDTYTLRGLRRGFARRFRVLESDTHRVGFDQMIRVLPSPLNRWWPQRFAEVLDRSLSRWFGFYLLLTAEEAQPCASDIAHERMV